MKILKAKCKDKVVLITGASSGIGAQLAREFGARGARVVLTARREDRLLSLERELSGKGIQAMAVACDVTRHASLDSAVRLTVEKFGGIDITVANAGFAVAGKLEELTVEDYRRQFETNVFGVLNTIYATLDALKKSRGVLGIIGSVAGHLAFPGVTAYSMSKFAVKGLAGGLQLELAPHGVGVTLICPGFVKSEIYQVDNEGVYRDEDTRPHPTWLMVPTDRAAREIAQAVLNRKPEAMITGHAKVAALLNRASPRLMSYLLGVESRRIAKSGKSAS